MLVLGWQAVIYLKNRENATADAESSPEASEVGENLSENLSAQESQIAADIESSDVLQELLQQQEQPIPSMLLNPQSDRDEPQGLFDRVSAEGLDTNDVLGRFSVSTPSTPGQTQNPPGQMPLANGNTPVESGNLGETPQSDRANPYTSTVLPNVLQTALERSGANSSGSALEAPDPSLEATPSPNPTGISPAAPQDAADVAQRWNQQFTGTGQVPPATLPTGVQPGIQPGVQSGFSQPALPESPYSNHRSSSLTDLKRSSSGVPASTQPNVPTYEVPGGNPYGSVPAPTPVAPGNYNYNIPSTYSYPGTTVQPTVPYTNPYQAVDPNSPNSAQFQFEQPQPQRPSSALETPIPGRYIGGGEINTFANP